MNITKERVEFLRFWVGEAEADACLPGVNSAARTDLLAILDDYASLKAEVERLNGLEIICWFCGAKLGVDAAEKRGEEGRTITRPALAFGKKVREEK